MEQDYKDPKDLREIPLSRLKYEGNKLAHQFREWNDFFDIESAIRVNNKKLNNGPDSITEVQRWSILSNRYLLMEREHLTDYKLFTKEEVLKMVHDAYVQGFNDCRYRDDKEKEWIETEKEYMKKMQTI